MILRRDWRYSERNLNKSQDEKRSFSLASDSRVPGLAERKRYIDRWIRINVEQERER